MQYSGFDSRSYTSIDPFPQRMMPPEHICNILVPALDQSSTNRMSLKMVSLVDQKKFARDHEAIVTFSDLCKAILYLRSLVPSHRPVRCLLDRSLRESYSRNNQILQVDLHFRRTRFVSTHLGHMEPIAKIFLYNSLCSWSGLHSKIDPAA